MGMLEIQRRTTVNQKHQRHVHDSATNVDDDGADERGECLTNQRCIQLAYSLKHLFAATRSCSSPALAPNCAHGFRDGQFCGSARPSASETTLCTNSLTVVPSIFILPSQCTLSKVTVHIQSRIRLRALSFAARSSSSFQSL